MNEEVAGVLAVRCVSVSEESSRAVTDCHKVTEGHCTLEHGLMLKNVGFFLMILSIQAPTNQSIKHATFAALL